jgi:chromosomal replication initiator protein
VTDDHDHIWAAIQDELRQAVPADMYDVWLAPLRMVGVEDDVLVVEAPRELRAWVAERFARVLQASVAAVLGPEVTVDVRSGASTGRGPRGAAHAGAAHAREARTSQVPDHHGINPTLTFEHFVIGDANRFAHAAALAVAELPGHAYNPLFIYGPPGVGKTHLLHSIGNYVLAYGAGLTVRYTTVETFTNQFLAALQRGDMDRFKGSYRHADVLLIDDVQFLASKAKTEEEFFHTFNAVHDLGSQLVLTSDRLPRDLGALEDRLRERFEAGLVTAIEPPDLGTRVAVLRKRAQHDGIVLADDGVLPLLAARAPDSVRTLEGALIRVVAYASLTGRPLTTALAEKVLADLYPVRPGQAGDRPAPVTVEAIQEITADAFGVTREELLSSSRAARLAWPRQVAMYLAREHTGETLPAIGARFAGRNHTTVLHACRRTAQRIAADPEAFDFVRRLTERLAPAVRGQTAPRSSLRHD